MKWKIKIIYNNETLPYLQTDLLLEEIANLRLRVLDTKINS